MDGPGVRQASEGSGEQKKKKNQEETGCEVVCGAPMTRAVKGESTKLWGMGVTGLVVIHYTHTHTHTNTHTHTQSQPMKRKLDPHFANSMPSSY